MTKEIKLRSNKHKRRKRKTRLWVKVFLSIVTLLVIGAGIYVYNVYNHAKNTVNEKMNTDVTAIDRTQASAKLNQKDIINVLLLGVDEREEVDGSRSDTILVVSLNPKNEKLTMVSIPRDTRTEIIGKGKEDKINHAYSFGGPDMTIETVENLLDIELDYYVEMNMIGLADLVDAIGGITVYNELEWIDEGFYKAGYRWKEGYIDLDGDKTIGYVRMRKKDPAGDFGRTERQRKVINAIIDKGTSMATVTKLHDVIDVVGDNMRTNMTFNDMKGLLLNYMDVTKNIESYMLEGEGTSIKGIYYYIVSNDELEKVNGMLTGKEVVVESEETIGKTDSEDKSNVQ